jgi:hypothetical protein
VQPTSEFAADSPLEGDDAHSFTVVATPTSIQARAFSFLAVDPTTL